MQIHGGNDQSQPSFSATKWPPKNGLSTHIVSRGDTILPIHARIVISAPASVIWSVLLDTSSYSSWNSFCPSVTIRSQPNNIPEAEAHVLHLNTSFTFNVIMDASKPSKVTPTQLRVTDISTPQKPSNYIPPDVLGGDGTFEADLQKLYRIAWTTEGGFVARGLKSERFHKIIVLEDDRCEVRTWECQGGVLARAVKYYYKDVLMTKFEEWCADCKTNVALPACSLLNPHYVLNSRELMQNFDFSEERSRKEDWRSTMPMKAIEIGTLFRCTLAVESCEDDFQCSDALPSTRTNPNRDCLISVSTVSCNRCHEKPITHVFIHP